MNGLKMKLIKVKKGCKNILSSFEGIEFWSGFVGHFEITANVEMNSFPFILCRDMPLNTINSLNNQFNHNIPL